MTTSLSGKASARADDVMSGLDVRMPVQAGQSTADLAEQMLARVRAEGSPGAAAAAPNVRPSAKPGALAELSVRAPPGPKAPPAAPAGPAAKVAGAAPSTAPQAAGQQGAATAKPASSVSSNGPVAAVPPGAAPPPAGPALVTASSLIDETAAWLPAEPERRTAFLQVYRYWHKQVLPEHAHKAPPAFLFLVTALPMMIKARDDLMALNLWEPPGEQSRQARDQHSAWRKYCEFLPRATQALQELDNYRHLSLLTGLDDLMDRIVKAEKRFREGNPKR